MIIRIYLYERIIRLVFSDPLQFYNYYDCKLQGTAGHLNINEGYVKHLTDAVCLVTLQPPPRPNLGRNGHSLYRYYLWFFRLVTHNVVKILGWIMIDNKEQGCKERLWSLHSSGSCCCLQLFWRHARLGCKQTSELCEACTESPRQPELGRPQDGTARSGCC